MATMFEPASARHLVTTPAEEERKRQPPPKVTIKLLEQPPRLPANLEEESWSSLQTAVRGVFAKEALPGGVSRELTYRLVEAVCASGFAAQLASRLGDECATAVRGLLAGLGGSVAGGGGGGGVGGAGELVPLLLRRVASAWEDHCAAMRNISMMFLHLDRSHILLHGTGSESCRAHSIWGHGLALFREGLLAVPGAQEAVCNGMLRLLDEERRGAEVPGALLASLGSMYAKLGIYAELFEPPFLERAATFYRAEAEEEIALRGSLSQYLLHCEQRLTEEKTRCEARLQDSTVKGLLHRVRTELIQKHAERLLDDGFAGLVEDHHLDDLSRLYRLLDEVDELPLLRRFWDQLIQRMGAKIMRAGAAPEESRGIVPALLAFHAKLREILTVAFKNSSDLALALKDAFQGFLNADGRNVSAKLLARYVDEVIRSENPCGDQELEQSIERIMELFRHISAKDAFEAFFRKDLAKRLLTQRSACADADAMMLQRLRSECGAGFTSKLEGMVRDMDLSKSILQDFLAEPDVRPELDEAGLDFEAVVLTSGLWPAQLEQRSEAPRCPPAAAKLQEMYAAFYAARHSGRSLHWSPSLGQCVLRASYQGGVRKELAMSHLQALVLLLFNWADRLTAKEIGQATHMPTADLHRTLQSLSLHKTVKLLLKESKGRETSDDDIFAFNRDFSHKLYRISVQQIAPKEEQDEEAGVEKRLFEDRQHQIDAAIVRIMKGKKVLTHQQLLAEVFSAVGASATPADVKKRIESLIEREYLERDLEHAATYNYRA